MEDIKNVEKKKNNYSIIKVCLIIILMITFAGIGFIGGTYYYQNSQKNKTTNKEKENNSTKTKEEKEVELSEEEIKSLDSIILELNEYFSNYYDQNITSIPNQNLLIFALKKIGFNNTISKDEIESVLKKYFGENVKVIHEPIKCNISEHEPMYYYENGVYSENKNHGGHGGGISGGTNSEIKFISGTKKGNIVTANYKIAHYNTCGDTCALYQLYDMTKKGKTLIYSTEKPDKTIEPLQYTNDIYESIKDKLHITKFTFELSDNNYHLKNVELED